MKVTVIDSLSGRPRTMDRRYADILTKLGRARYMTRDMKAQGDTGNPVSETGGDKTTGNPAATAATKRARKTAAKRARKTTSKPK